jgi:hypothetical protein
MGDRGLSGEEEACKASNVARTAVKCGYLRKYGNNMEVCENVQRLQHSRLSVVPHQAGRTRSVVPGA